MPDICDLADHPLALQLGWTLLHFVWQGAVLALAAACGLGLLRRRTPGARYGVCLMCLAAMAAAPAVTFLLLTTPSPMVAQGILPVIGWEELANERSAGDDAYE